MSSTEQDLRDLLADRSAATPSAPDRLAQVRRRVRRRHVWVAVAAATAILVIAAAGITLGVKPPKATPATPQPKPSPTAKLIRFQANRLSPPATVQLPQWIAFAKRSFFFGGYSFDQPSLGYRAIRLFSVDHMYPLGGARMTQPGYAALVADWKAIQSHGHGIVSDLANTAVDGRPATTMTVRTYRAADGFVYCPDPRNPANPDRCDPLIDGSTYHVVIVDQGTTEPPTLLLESAPTDFTANAPSSNASVASEFATWLATIRFH
jgi:hypothetical protein